MIKLLASAAIFLSTGVVTAQDSDNNSKLQFGLKLGLNYSNVYNSSTEEFVSDPKFGFAGGAMMRIPIGEFLGLQPEVLFSKKGFDGEGRILGSEYNFTRTTTFIDVPFLFALKPNEFLAILAGPQYSYLIKRKDVFTNTIVSYSQEQEFKNDNIRKNIFGFVIGLDLNVDKVVVGARMCWDIQSNNGDGTSDTPRYKNTWFQGTIGYMLF